MLMNCHFDHYNLMIYFMQSIWRSKSTNYSLALETRNGDNMQCNASEVNERRKMECLQVPTTKRSNHSKP